MPSLPLVVPGDLSIFYGQNTRISRESRLLNILNRRIFLQRNTYLSVKVALFPDEMLNLNCAPKVGHNKFKHERIKVSN